jgi:hypothetical protein
LHSPSPTLRIVAFDPVVVEEEEEEEEAVG